MEGKNKGNGREVREVALSLRERFVQSTQPRQATTEPTAVAERPSEPPKKKEPTKVQVNAPLDFSLKTLETDHLWFGARKLSTETVERFGLGFCKRGSLAGRIAIPLMDDASKLVGYAGLSLGDDGGSAPEGGPKYLFPVDREKDGVTHRFDRSAFLYNGFRVAPSAKLLFVVTECAPVWAVSQAGFPNVVGLMGDDCTDEQAQLIMLMTAGSARVWLIADGSAAGDRAARSFLPKVAPSRLCRWMRIAAGEEILPGHPALSDLPKK